MHWNLNSKQKRWIRRLLRSENPYVDVWDILEENWPAGQLEISTFQQKLVVHLDGQESQKMDDIVIHMMEVCDLFRQLEKEHLIRSWHDLPNEDNTRWIGEKKDAAIPHYLPDLDVAAEMLKWFGKKIQVRDGLIALEKRNFRDETLHHLMLNRRIYLSGMVMVGLLILLTGFYFIGDRLNNLEREVILNKQQDKESLDSLNASITRLYDLNYRMATDTQQRTALKVVGDAVDRSIDQMDRKTAGLEARIIENRELLRSSDSLLQRLFLEE